MYRFFLIFLFCIGLFIVGCDAFKRSHSYAIDEAIHIQTDATEPMHCSGVQQIVAFHDDVYSGSKPTSPEGMESLMKMDVRTIICVDGVSPDVSGALQYGIKTIHLPMKYIEPTSLQIFELTTATMMGLDRGKVYIHCHHGKHRSATAAAIVSIALGFSTIKEAKSRMLISETSTQYKGLWDAVEKQEVINVIDLIRNEKKFPSSVKPIEMTSQMVAIDEAMDRLRVMQIANWKIPESHPDLAPASDAGFIAETFRAMQFDQESPFFQVDFTSQVINAMHQASGLEAALIQNSQRETLHQFMKQVEQSCVNCHEAFRK